MHEEGAGWPSGRLPATGCGDWIVLWTPYICCCNINNKLHLHADWVANMLCMYTA